MPIDTHDLHPELTAKVRELERLAAAEAIFPSKTSGARGFRRQALLGRTWAKDTTADKQEARAAGIVAKPAPMGLSRHHPFYGGKSAAVDLDAGPGPAANDPKQKRLTELARGIGLRCGIDWGDPVHYELAAIDGKPLDPWLEYERLGKLLDRQVGYPEVEA